MNVLLRSTSCCAKYSALKSLASGSGIPASFALQCRNRSMAKAISSTERSLDERVRFTSVPNSFLKSLAKMSLFTCRLKMCIFTSSSVEP